ncbi:MAG: hypothetical protein IKX44_03805 [Prevotella sp.]|nr:hypothetical protein [Prevotella sp.]
MKKVYLALMCMASFVLMTACGGNKKADVADAEKENAEVVEDTDEEDDGVRCTEGEEDADSEEAVANPADAQALDLETLYANGDFKPAEGVVFEDNLTADKDGELPTKWDIKEGSAEVNACGERNIIKFVGGYAAITPLLNGKSDFLTDVWSLEYEYFMADYSPLAVRFFNKEEEEIGNVHLYSESVTYGFCKTDDETIDGENPDLSKTIKKGWNHFGISFNKGNVKVFVNGKRIANLPNVKQPVSFIVYGQEGHYITNIRVTK